MYTCKFEGGQGYEQLGILFDNKNWGSKKWQTGTCAYVLMQNMQETYDATFCWKEHVYKDSNMKLRCGSMCFEFNVYEEILKALSNRILNRETKDLNTLGDEKLINDQIGVVLAFDGLKNILNQNIFGSLFITSSGEILIWDASDINNECERLIEVMKDLIQEIDMLNIKLNAIVSDTASA
ncbi:hypothetical protein RhiirC2_780483 [Rhizophagus irregularis]|uniref:Uncharacterized protein n=1 Tax=Rhizophagus irregularis TaxID=588596 RepID=A0A2N1N7M4_9GLOM|nr:hypothetical protein RhiirC2_780483 [Rhizophagus irregularis]